MRDPVAYAYQAAVWCPRCIGHAFAWHGYSPRYNVRTEEILDLAARQRGIDRYQADTNDFPYPMFSHEVTSDESCDQCLQRADDW